MSHPFRIALLLVPVSILLLLVPVAPARAQLVDVASQFGLPQSTHTWDIAVGEIDGDGAADVVISYHGSIVVYRNALPGLDVLFSVQGGDVHGCAIADVDQNGLGDVYCTRGAAHGRPLFEKENDLWIQSAPGTFQDLAVQFGVEDPFGRGRRTTFLDLDHDAFPDLFVGNAYPRLNGRPSPNRTFVDADGSAFDEVDLGVTRERGAFCVQAVDQNGDGWDDLLVCGAKRLLLYRRVPGAGFQQVAGSVGAQTTGVQSARLVDLNEDGRIDLALVRRSQLIVLPGLRGHVFGSPVLVRALRKGSWVAVGNVDGRRNLDLYVVQSCVDGSDMRDVLLVAKWRDWRYEKERVPRPAAGCGDVAATVDLNGDGADEVIVLNGDGRGRGPVQIISTAWGS